MNLWSFLPINSRIAFIIVGLLSLLIIFGIPGLNSDWFQLPRNYDANDNSQNWANHEYGHNLMLSAEPNSIFMTEGGDNQVFSLLYFATVERKRPDIDFFDQKGNVFPRLYGDLLNTHPNEIELIRNIRDFQLFSTGRPVYLTWERPNLEKLNINTFRQQKKEILSKLPPNMQNVINSKYRFDSLDQLKNTTRNMVSKSVYNLTLRSGGNLAEQDFRYLGPWYLKNFGMVFRVTPLRYAIVDTLELLGGSGNLSTINPEVGRLTKLVMIPQQFDYYVEQLQNEGYVKREGDTVVIIRPFRGQFDHIDPITLWDYYQASHLNVPNAHNWDFLTREIFANTIRLMSLSVGREINALKKQHSQVSDTILKNAITEKINYWNKRLNDTRKTAPIYNYDNPSMTLPYAQQMQRKNNLPEAINLYVMSARANYHYNNAYLQASELTLKLAERDRGNQEQYLNEARSYLKEFYRAQDIYSAMTSKPTQENKINIARNIEKRINSIQNNSIEQVEALEQSAGNDIRKLNDLVRLYQERGEYNQAIEVMEKIQKLEPLQFKHYLKIIDFTKDNRLDIALKYADEAVSKYSELQGEKPPVWELDYYRGSIFFNYANVLKKQDPNDKTQNNNLLIQAQQKLQSFLDNFQLVKDSADANLRQKANNAEKILERIEADLK